MAEEKDLVTRFFEPWEGEPVDSWESAKARIQKIVDISRETTSGGYRLVWRGLNDSKYAMHSSLYRHLQEDLGQPPTENQIGLAENEILRRAREDWRFGNLKASETFAQIRHYGAPTKLIDVSFNPLIALWFAVQPSDEDKEGGKPADGRIIASVLTTNDPERLKEEQDKKNIPGSAIPVRKSPYIWKPAVYNERISAQNSAFLVGEIPQRIEPVSKLYDYPKDFRNVWHKIPNYAWYSDPNGEHFWNPHDDKEQDLEPEYSSWELSEVQKVTSVNLNMASIEKDNSEITSPTFTIRISGWAKEKIREELEYQFGYTKASLYPDLYGLAEHLTISIKDSNDFATMLAEINAEFIEGLEKQQLEEKKLMEKEAQMWERLKRWIKPPSQK